MKKSNKKIKSDRINALRKQYDYFLEEDKKRKECNELILNKLDKMRSCNATVPLRTTPALNTNQQQGFYNKPPLEKSSIYDKFQTSPTRQQLLETSAKHLSDSIVLQEITKKYILIPKRTSAFQNEYPQTLKPATDCANDSDWKSKYDILKQLKQNDQPKRDEEKKSPIKEIKHINNDEYFVKGLQYEPTVSNYISDKLVTEPQLLEQNTNRYPEQDITAKNNDKVKHDENYNMQVDIPNMISNGKHYDNNKVSTKVMNGIECKVVNTSNVSEKSAESMMFNNPVGNINKQINFNNPPISKTLEYSQIDLNNSQCNNEHPCQRESRELEESIVRAVESVTISENPNLNYEQDIKTDKLTIENTYDSNVLIADKHQCSEDVKYPIDILNVQEITTGENLVLQHDVNINPHTNQEDSSFLQESKNEQVVEVENPVDVAGIEAFNAEQREMFYTEQPNENYAHDQIHPSEQPTENYAYDQTNSSEPQNENYADDQTNPDNAYPLDSQNESYQQNEQYAYYEGAPADQTYPTEVNEFEETSQPYDQSYQEQYAAYDPEYEQQQIYEQVPQQYQHNQEIDPNIQPVMEQIQYEQLNYEPENVEQQLDDEQSYTQNEQLENTHAPLSDMEKQELQNSTREVLSNSEIRENVIQDNTVNN